MRLATYNIKHGSLKGLEAVARTLEPLGADLVALQEVDERVERSGGVDQARWVGDRLGMAPVFAPAFDLEGGRYGLALLSRLPVRAHRTVRLPSASDVPLADGVEPRVLLEVDLGPGFTVVVAHLGLAPYERIAQADVIVDRLGPRTLLAGDLNTGPGSPAFVRLEGRLADCLADAGLTDRATFPSGDPLEAIDHVLRTFDLPAARSAFRPASDASDHLPLVVDFVIPIQP